MRKILLVEPNYKNKYPPIGLMKLSTYFKSKGYFVEFHKGVIPSEIVEKFDKVFITTLFTFDFDICVSTINYYVSILGKKNVYVGGIAATIISQKFSDAIPGIRLVEGQLTNSNKIGYKDNVNIDALDLDYDILWDVDYEYPAADGYFIYTSRGCFRGCPFCAVRILEPKFYECDNVIEQIKRVDKHFGCKQNLLIMDNNFLYSHNVSKVVNGLIEMGFGIENHKQAMPNIMERYLSSLRKRTRDGRVIEPLLNRIKLAIIRISEKKSLTNESKKLLSEIIKDKVFIQDDLLIKWLLDNEDKMIGLFFKYDKHVLSRWVDFNQGLDGRLFNEKNVKELAKLAINPCRIAFDDIAMKDKYLSAMALAVRNGIRRFSNYILYNYKDKPEDLWQRLHLNISFAEKYKKKGITLFSFPMKYADIERIDRNSVGEYWHKKYLRAINVILNVTKGVVAKEKDFFQRAFGRNQGEFMLILTMPDDFIRYRQFYEDTELTSVWKNLYKSLSSGEKKILLNVLDSMIDEPELLKQHYSKRLDKILQLYSINRKKVEKNKAYYKRMIENI